MHKEKFVFFVVVILLLSGCTKITNNLDEVIDATMVNSKQSVNTVSTGYELCIPTGVKQVFDSKYNQKFKIKNRYVYLYVDTISYYYKNMLNYNKENSYNYYYRELNLNGKTGYIGINKTEDNLYFVEIIYNYSKMEFYTDLDDMPLILANCLIMQKSIKYNDSLISLEINDNINEGREITYELDGPADNKSTFSDYLQEYVAEEEEENEIELPEDING